MLSDLLLDELCMGADSKMVLNHLPGNAEDVICLPCKNIDIPPREGDERACLFAAEGGAYSESPARDVLLDGHLLGFRWCSLRFIDLAGAALWHVLDGSAALRRGALAGGLARRGLAGRDLARRGLAGLFPSRGFSGRSKCLGGSC